MKAKCERDNEGKEKTLNLKIKRACVKIEVSSQTTISYTLSAQGIYWGIDVQNQYFHISKESDLEEFMTSLEMR